MIFVGGWGGFRSATEFASHCIPTSAGIKRCQVEACTGTENNNCCYQIEVFRNIWFCLPTPPMVQFVFCKLRKISYFTINAQIQLNLQSQSFFLKEKLGEITANIVLLSA